MSQLILAILFLAAAALTGGRGPKWVFPFVLLPAVLLGFTIKPLAVPFIPDVTSVAALCYGVIVGMGYRVVTSAQPLNFRPHPIDLMLVAVMGIAVLSNVYHKGAWEGVSTAGNEGLLYLGPYFLGRLALFDRDVRAASLKILSAISLALLLPALVEWRLYPMEFSRALEQLGITEKLYNQMTMGRFGFYRTMVTFPHPIDTGNAMALVAGMIAAFAYSTGRSLRDPKVYVPLAAALVVALTSMSFTTFMVLGLAAGLVALMAWVPRAAGLLVPLVICMYLAGVAATIYLINTPPDINEDGSYGSFTMRHIIVQATWKHGAEGNFLGLRDVDEVLRGEADLHHASVDNAYMLFILERGWVYFLAFTLLPLALAVPAGRALRNLPPGRQRLPLMIAFAMIVSTMAGMYTVYFGFSYAVLWMMTLGLTVSMAQHVLAATAVVPPAMRRGSVANPHLPRAGRAIGETLRPGPVRAVGR